MSIEPLPYFNDNYSFLVKCKGDCILIDCGDGDAIFSHLQKRNITPSTLFVTHNHKDHLGGVQRLQELLPSIRVVLPEEAVQHDFKSPTAIAIKAIHTPGHTLEHTCYYLPEEAVLFTGDTLFAGGTGRCFTKEFTLFYNSIKQLLSLPATTILYGAHEYLVYNRDFLHSLQCDTTFYDHRLTMKYPSLGISLADELSHNRFLQLCQKSTVEEFKKLRLQKDDF